MARICGTYSAEDTKIDNRNLDENTRPSTQVKRFLEEGGKKKVYLAQDTLLDRKVGFALIKTEGLDEVSRTRITREAQAMGRLGSHPHIVRRILALEEFIETDEVGAEQQYMT